MSKRLRIRPVLPPPPYVNLASLDIWNILHEHSDKTPRKRRHKFTWVVKLRKKAEDEPPIQDH
jgi:hypothetical protein